MVEFDYKVRPRFWMLRGCKRLDTHNCGGGGGRIVITNRNRPVRIGIDMSLESNIMTLAMSQSGEVYGVPSQDSRNLENLQ